MTAAQAERLGIPEPCVVVSLPHHVHVSSNQQLAEKVCVVDIGRWSISSEDEDGHDEGEREPAADTPNIYEPLVDEPHLIGLQAGTCLLRRQSKACTLPSGLTSLPRIAFPCRPPLYGE